MTGLEIALLLTGVVFIVVSFFVTEKLSASDLDEIKKASEREIKIILEKQMAEASGEIEDRMREKEESAMESLERKTDQETNEKIMAISEFSDTVLDAMNKSHNEIIFMYDMLNDKQQHATELMKDLQKMESAVFQMEETLDAKKEELQGLLDEPIDIVTPEPYQETAKVVSMEEALKEHNKQEADPEDTHNNAVILRLYKQGISEVEIAKKLGCGLGEVKLVVGLFHGGRV
jgi:hypothetical protein